jgi:hypothetical protein
MSDALFVMIAGNEVPLTYYDMDPQTLRQIKKYPPFAEWVGSFKKTKEFSINSVDIQTVEWIGKRIDGLTAAVELQSCTGEKMVQTMATNSGATVAVVLPVIQTEEGHFLFNEIQSLANVGATCYTALEGTVTASKEVTLKDAAVLEGMGLTPGPGDITPLSPKAYHCSTEGSTEMVKFYVWHIPRIPPASGLASGLSHANGKLIVAKKSAVMDPPSKKAMPLPIIDANTVLALNLYQKMQS